VSGTPGRKERSPRERADLLVVRQGLAESREKARALIMAGSIHIGERRVEKAGEKIPTDAELSLVGNALPYVGRGGLKMEDALDGFGIDPEGMTVLDVGSSTGGFTDCLLQRGARKVYALDVGRGQLHWKLRQDPRVQVMEGVNARYLAAGDVPEPIHLATVDVSFISLRLVVPAVRAAAAPESWVLLIKPQFEVGREKVEPGGLVTDPSEHRRVLEEMLEMAEKEQLSPAGLRPSPVRGAEGNQEFLVHLRPGGRAPDRETLQGWIREAVT
jgi:23S rRNA (cytidine1920-2'-O)/16S rRNA (cytidine1409-2'-O)-methyltransferase